MQKWKDRDKLSAHDNLLLLTDEFFFLVKMKAPSVEVIKMVTQQLTNNTSKG